MEYSLLKLDKWSDLPCSEWDIFLKLFWYIPWMLVHYCQIITNFLFVFQSFNWFTSLMKLGKYGDETSFWNFWRHSWDIGTLVWNSSESFCMSVSLVVGILPQWNLINLGISPALYDISFWIFMDTFLGCWCTCSE